MNLPKLRLLRRTHNAFKFEMFLNRCAIATEMKETLLDCTMRSSFAIALVANDWNFFIHGLEKAVKHS